MCLMTVKIFCCSYVKTNRNIHTRSHTKVEKLNSPPFFAMFLASAPGTVTLPHQRATHPPTHMQKTYKYTLTHAQFQRRDSRWCVTRQHLKVPWQAEKEFSAPCAPVSQIYHWDSLMAAFVTYYCFIFSSPSPSPQKFLFCSYF